MGPDDPHPRLPLGPRAGSRWMLVSHVRKVSVAVAMPPVHVDTRRIRSLFEA